MGAASMSEYWSSFASLGDPNARNQSTLLEWPKYNATDDMILRFDVEPSGIFTQQGLRKDACNFWDSRGERFASPDVHIKEYKCCVDIEDRDTIGKAGELSMVSTQESPGRL